MYNIFKTKEYQKWFDDETEKSQFQILKRLSAIELDEHFGDHKSVGESIWELRWANGRRLYYAYLEELQILLLLGGNKNGQSKDIAQAKKIFKKNTEA